ncbi:MAG TPA: LysM domain-containing protein [Acidimicrobiales bacterium]|nr:LysM domain-containing protein [Acidimicrobiales bacterium]
MRIRQITSLVTVVTGECAALVLLHRVGSVGAVDWGDPGRWLAATPPEDALVEVVRLAGLVLAWWLTVTTVLYVLARLTRVPSLVRSVEWATLAPVRRVVDGVLATSIVAGSTFGSATMALAEHAPSPVVVQLDQPKQREAPEPAYRPRPAGNGIAPQSDSEPRPTSTTTVPAASDGTPRLARMPAPPAIEAAALPSSTPTTYVVQAGDSLWRIAERQVAAPTGRSPDDIGVAEVHAYWVHLVETNRHRLRSGDPDLIHPDEVLVLPASTDPNPTG